MEKKNRIEIVKELASNVEVIFKPNGTWVDDEKVQEDEEGNFCIA